MTPLANTIMSGCSDHRSTPNQLPSRPNPQMTESAMKSTSYSAQTAATPSR